MVDSTIDNLMKNETLAGGAQEDLAGKKMREGKREGEEESPADGDKGLRERWMDAKRAMDLKQRAKDKLEEKVMAPAKKWTEKIYINGWVSMATIVGFLPGLLIIDCYLFLRAVLGKKLFPNLTEIKEEKKSAFGGNKLTKKADKSALWEYSLILFLNLVVLFAIFMGLGFIVIIVKLITNPIGALWAFWQIGWGGVKLIWNSL